MDLKQRVLVFLRIWNDGKKEEQVIFKSSPDSDYRWFKEDGCRTAFGDRTYIKPDIAGRDSSTYFTDAVCPNIILEVIRTHPPEEKTFQKLVGLSISNHQVYFYFIAEGMRSSAINHYRKLVKGNFNIRVSHYLIGGKVFVNGKERCQQEEGESFDRWYSRLKDEYFESAMKKVKEDAGEDAKEEA